MAWIEVHQSLPTHKKTRRLARELKLNTKDYAKAVGHMVMFWLWAMDNAPDGDLSEIDIYDIADAAQWSGDPQKFFDAMKKAGFVDEDNCIHDWDAYIGRLIDKREANARRNREARAKKKAAKEQGRDGSSAQDDASRDDNERITSVSRDASRDTENASRDGATVPNQPNQPNQPYQPSSSGSVIHTASEAEEEKFPPTREMVEEYIRSKGWNVDAQEFIERCESAGWRDGEGRKIANWRLWLAGYAVRAAKPVLGARIAGGADPRLAALEALKGGG